MYWMLKMLWGVNRERWMSEIDMNHQGRDILPRMTVIQQILLAIF